MIRSTLEPSFARYGRIEPHTATQSDTLRTITLIRSEPVALYRFPSDTVWDYDSGMTVLLIRDEEEDLLYYLDRIVTIHADVCFGFYPMGAECTLRCASALAIDAEPLLYCPLPEPETPVTPMKILTRFRQHGRGGLYFRGERHAPVELCYLEKGVLHSYCEGQKLTLHAGELLIFGSDQWHMQYSDEDVQFLTVSFQWEAHDMSEWAGQIIPVTPEMQHSLSALQQPWSWPEPEEFYQAHLKLLLLHIMEQPLRHERRKKALPASEQLHRVIINKAMQTISDRICERLTVPMLAAAVNVSTSQLTALFQTYLGISPAKYITQLRLEESKILLSVHRLSVGEAASRLNYSSVQHFSRQFHDWFGCSPSAFVKLQQP